MITTLVYILGCIYSCFEGIREGYYYESAIKTGDADKYNLHGLFWLQRFLVCGSCIFINPLLPIMLVMLFSFFHNGAYYITREKLSTGTYSLGFISNSTTSTANMELNFTERTVCFILSLIILIIS